MENKNNKPAKAIYWLWTDNNTVIVHPAGVLVIKPEDWQDFTEAAKAEYRPVRTNDGVTGWGTIVGKFLLVMMD